MLPAYISKANSTLEKQIILLMITNKEKEGWHYLAVTKLSALLHKKTSAHNGDFHCLNCLNSFRTESKLKYHERLCKNKDFCEIVLLSEQNNILKFNNYTKSDKMLCIIATLNASLKK